MGVETDELEKVDDFRALDVEDIIVEFEVADDL
jgi:hypothetical protein